jgi:uncharacterized protein YxjI
MTTPSGTLPAMSNASATPAGWYPDPGGKHEYRYWDGSAWNDYVANRGQQSIDPLAGPGVIPTTRTSAERIQRQVQEQAGVAAPPSGGGTIFSEPVLVVNQKAKLIEVNNEFAIYDGQGRQVGAVREVGQSAAKKALRVLTSFDQYLTHQFQVVDMAGVVQLVVTRPAKLVKSRVIVADGVGRELGVIRQENAIGKIRFAFEVGDQRVGGIQAETWRAWNFSIRDGDDEECARITKTWEGLARTMFTTADNYVVQIHRQLEEPLRSLVVASAVCVDTALKQDSRGLT